MTNLRFRRWILFLSFFTCTNALLIADTHAESSKKFPIVHAFRSIENGNDSNNGGYSKHTASSPYLDNLEIVHYGTTLNYDEVLLETEKNRGDSVITILHAQSGGIDRKRIGDLNKNGNVTESDYVFPGYWLFQVGSFAVDEIPAASTDDATVIEVESLVDDNGYSLFSVNDEVMITYYDASGKERLWSTFESAKITAVDESSNSITVLRGQSYGHLNPTEARNWQTDTYEVLITAHVKYNDEDNKVLNLSPQSPKDPLTGLNGYEFFVADFITNIWEKSATDGTTSLDGVIFDAGRGLIAGDASIPIDINNDLTADYGFIDGINLFGLGVQMYLELLREKLPDKIIMIDSSTVDEGYRNRNSPINGIEDENFWHKGQTYSEAYLHLKNWHDNTKNRTSYTYGFTKEDTLLYSCGEYANEDSKPKSNARFRVGLAASLLIGSNFPYAAETEAQDSIDGDAKQCYDVYDWDEFTGGKLNDWDWLGGASSEAIQDLSLLGSTNLLESATWDCKTETQTGTKAKCGDSTSDYQATFTSTLEADNTYSRELVISSLPQKTFVLNDNYYPSVGGVFFRAEIAAEMQKQHDKEFTLLFDAEAELSQSYTGSYSLASDLPPKFVRIKLTDTNNRSYFQNVLVGNNSQTYRLSFTLDNSAGIKKILFFSGEEAGTLKVKNIELVTGSANLWTRYFEGGAVIVNATGDSRDVALDTQYSSNGYKRITGTYDPSVNTGAHGSGTSKNIFTIPAEDALLVIANSPQKNLSTTTQQQKGYKYQNLKIKKNKSFHLTFPLSN